MTEPDRISQIKADADLLFTGQQVEAAIDRMAKEICQSLGNTHPLFLCVLNGGIVTAGQLMLRCQFPMNFDVIHASRYQGGTVGDQIEWISKPRESLAGRTILVVDDILDEGITLEAIYKYCGDQGAASVYSAVLVDKKLDKKKPVRADFSGLQAENRYLFGYGMDYKGYWRNAKGIFACQEF